MSQLGPSNNPMVIKNIQPLLKVMASEILQGPWSLAAGFGLHEPLIEYSPLSPFCPVHQFGGHTLSTNCPGLQIPFREFAFFTRQL